MFTVLNAMSADCLYVKHVCFYTESLKEFKGQDCLQLIEIVLVGYRHPEAPDVAIIECLERRYHCEQPRTSLKAAPLVLLEAIQKLKFDTHEDT